MREKLAALQHEIWSHWMKYLFSQCNEVGDGCMEIPSKTVDRWLLQMDTPYAKLSERERKSDRDQADKVLTLIISAIPSDEQRCDADVWTSEDEIVEIGRQIIEDVRR